MNFHLDFTLKYTSKSKFVRNLDEISIVRPQIFDGQFKVCSKFVLNFKSTI